MSWVATAVIGSAVIGAGATLAGARSAASANDRATAAGADAADRNTRVAQEQDARAQAANAPYAQAGLRANRILAAINGVPQLAPQASAGSVYGSGYTAGGSRNWSQLLADRPDVAEEAARLGMNPNQYAELWYNQIGPAAGDSYTFPQTGGDAYGGADEPIDVAGLRTAYQGTVPHQIGEETYSTNDALINNEYADTNSILNSTLSGMNTEASDQFNRETNALGQQYGTRQGFTDTATAGRDYRNRRDREDLLNRAAGGFGVTGQIGNMVRQYARESDYLNASYEDDVRRYRNEDHTPYAEGFNASLGDFGDRRDRNLSAHYMGALGASENRSRQRFANTGSRAANRLDSYGQWEDYIRGVAETGYDAANRGVAAGAAAAQNIAAANTARANRYAQSAEIASNIYGGAARSIATIAGNVYGGWQRQPRSYGARAPEPYAANGNYTATTMTPAVSRYRFG